MLVQVIAFFSFSFEPIDNPVSCPYYFQHCNLIYENQLLKAFMLLNMEGKCVN